MSSDPGALPAQPAPVEIEAYLRHHIPISGAMEVRVVRAGSTPVLEVPLEPNRNHRDTAFGGSVAALAILAGWVHVHFRLRGEGHAAHTVIQKSSVDYDAPASSAFRAEAEIVESSRWARFTRTLDRYGKARVRVSAVVESDGQTVARFEGAYVALAIGDR